MFNNILHRAVNVGEKIFHILCDVATNADELEKFGLEVIKVAQQIKSAAEKPSDSEEKQCSDCVEEKKDV